MRVVVDPGGEEELFTRDDPQLHQVTDWSRDGKAIVYGRLDPSTKWDVWTAPTAAPPAGAARTPVPYLRTEFNEHQGRLSPDGRWMAYVSDESGRWEVYVGAFPTRGPGAVQISTGGGFQPQWRHDGKELFYLAPDQMLMSVAASAEAGFTAGAPRGLFKTRTEDRGARLSYDRDYLPAGDGRRFLINAVQEPAPSAITVVLNWSAGIKN
jgi:hypothetical protein